MLPKKKTYIVNMSVCSTYDRDNDAVGMANCAETMQAGWWFNDCWQANPNGVWELNGGKRDTSMPTISWNAGGWWGYTIADMNLKLVGRNG